MLPCCQSLVADYFRPESRGSGFACLFTASAIGEHKLGSLSGMWILFMQPVSTLSHKLGQQQCVRRSIGQHRQPGVEITIFDDMQSIHCG